MATFKDFRLADKGTTFALPIVYQGKTYSSAEAFFNEAMDEYPHMAFDMPLDLIFDNLAYPVGGPDEKLEAKLWDEVRAWSNDVYAQQRAFVPEYFEDDRATIATATTGA